MYIFGEFSDEIDIEKIFENADNAKRSLSGISIEKILNVLDNLSKAWKPGGTWYLRALEELPLELSFSKDMIQFTLNLVSDLLKKENLQVRLNSEFGNLNSLDNFVVKDNFAGKIKNVPIGNILHVSAGNVFLGCIDSLLMGFLTKNVNILKLSSKNQMFPKLFAESLLEIDKEKILSDKFSILYWKGGDDSFERRFKQNVDAIIAWGGESMLESYKKDLPMNVRLIDYGPKISVQVVSNEYTQQNSLADLSKKIVEDVAIWDQAACAASQNLFIESEIDVRALMIEISNAFKNYNLDRARLDDDEYVDLLKEKSRAQYSFSHTDIDFIEGKDYFIHYEPSDTLRPSPLNRTLIIKSYKNVKDLSKKLENFKFYLQTCGLAVTKDEKDFYLNTLSCCGIKRFTQIGCMLQGMNGGPHDGRFGLTELVNCVSYEHIDDLDNFLDDACRVDFYKDYKGKQLSDFPLSNGELITTHGVSTHDESLILDKKNSFIFASGGTIGNPKYSLYSSQEFEDTCKLLAKSYMQVGLKVGDIVANLFVSGNMWSSFSAVQLALQNCDVTQLPIGGLTSNDDIRNFFHSFRPNVVFGLPGMLVDLAIKNPDFKIEKIFYAGELLSDSSQETLKNKWGVKEFISAGYASVDVGPIGYQVKNGKVGEHYFFEHIHPEVIDNQLVVTSTLRKKMPIIRYQTGDRVQLLERDQYGQKFILLGRYDSLIQIWSCRININDIQESLNQFEINEFQVILTSNENEADQMTLLFENNNHTIDYFGICTSLYRNCSDLNQTITFERFDQYFNFEYKKFIKNKRTGKVSKVLDLR